MKANYRIVKIGKYFCPQYKCPHMETLDKNFKIQPIYEWMYFKGTGYDDQHFDTYEEALDFCVNHSKSQKFKFDEIINIVIDNGKIIEIQKQ